MKQLFVLICCLAFSAGHSFGNSNTTTTAETDQQFSDRVNLALRQVGHQLLKLAGDVRSTVPPVQITGANEFTLKLDHSFSYDTLPQLLNQAFLSYDIQRDYQVMVKQCNSGIPILGYNQAAFFEQEVPCAGRDLWADCSYIVLTFVAPTAHRSILQGLLIFWFVLSILLLIALGLFWGKIKRTIASTSDSSPISSTTSATISLGNFSFDHQNQTLQLGDELKQLTFRESKLLYFLASHTNAVVERDLLVEKVWGDEGVMVGRSLDVFISRLRKLLKEDKSVQIKNIHSVGYRLEVTI